MGPYTYPSTIHINPWEGTMRKSLIITIAAGILALGTALACGAGSSVDSNPTPAAPVTTAAAQPTPAAPTTAARPTGPTLTLSQANAVAKAKDYLSVESFSQKGLISQLEYEGFNASDATYGATHAGADWNAEAVAKAKEYLSTQSFSRSGLISQLEYEGFTSAQAQYGASGAGL